MGGNVELATRTNCAILSMFSATEMVPLVQRISRLALKTFSNMHDGSFNENLYELRTLASQISASDVKLNPNLFWAPQEVVPGRGGIRIPRGKAPVTYVSIVDGPFFTMGIFVIQQDCRIPIHDHPGMFGIIKVLHGKMMLQSYSRVDADDYLSESKAKIVPVVKMAAQVVDSNCESCCLMPVEGNFHELRSVGGATAFLDILAPPYRMGSRDCSYFLEKCDKSETKSNGIYLVQIPSPSDFWSDCAPYEGPKLKHSDIY